MHDTSLPSGTYALLASFSSCKDLDMNHVVLLLSAFLVEISSGYKYKISWLNIFKLKINWQSIILICLIPSVKLEAEFVTEVKDHLSNKSTAVEIKRRIIMLLTLAPVSACIRYSKILFTTFDKFVSKQLFELWICSILQALLTNIVSVFDILLFGSSKSIELRLETTSLVVEEIGLWQFWFFIIFADLYFFFDGGGSGLGYVTLGIKVV